MGDLGFLARLLSRKPYGGNASLVLPEAALQFTIFDL